MKIYHITNDVNDKLYVGQCSGTIDRRLLTHKRHARNKVNRCLYDAMNKYGVDRFSIHLIEEVPDRAADEREKFWIATLNTMMPNGYNMTEGGGGGNTLKAWSDEDRAALYKRQGEKRKGRRSEAWRLAIKEGALKREASYSAEKKAEIGNKIATTLKIRGIKPPKTVMYGKDNPNHVEVDVDKAVQLIAAGSTLKQLAVLFNTTGATVGAKIKAATGKTFTQWRRHHGVTGTFSKPQSHRA